MKKKANQLGTTKGTNTFIPICHLYIHICKFLVYWGKWYIFLDF